MSNPISLNSRLKGCFLGLAIGDAMGAPVEFKEPGDFVPVTEFRSGGPHDVEAGEWTDDMAMALCIADSLINNNGEINLTSILDNFVLWHEEGKFSSRGHCFDIGTTCFKALSHYKISKLVIAQTSHEYESGNGSLMRMAPVIVMFHQDLELLTQKCLETSRTTHASPIVDQIVMHFATIVFNLLSGMDKKEALKHYVPNPDATPTGFVVDSFDVAIMAFRDFSTFEEGLLHVVNQGDDADTVGAIYGQIAGAYYGADLIPLKWRIELWKASMLEEVFEKLWNLKGKRHAL